MNHRSQTTVFLAFFALLGASVLHVPLAAQESPRLPTGVPDTSGAPVEGLGAGVDAAAAPGDRIEVPFAGTYAVTVALGRDTANLFIRIPAEAEYRLLATPERSKGKEPPQAPVGGLVIPVVVSTDSVSLAAMLGNGPVTAGYMIAAPEGTAGVRGTRWWVTIMAGGDTTQSSGVSRLSRALLRLQQQREMLELGCLTDPKAENDVAKRRDELPPCDVASRLPVHRDKPLGDGVLFLGNDGRARVEQRSETNGGELTLWGSRVSSGRSP